MSKTVLLMLTIASVVAVLTSDKSDDVEERQMRSLARWLQPFREDARRILEYTSEGGGRGMAFDWLARLVDDFGPRQLGSANLERAIDFTVDRMLKEDAFDRVYTESVPDLPKWLRNENTVQIIEPRLHKMNILAIDGSPSADLSAEAIVLEDFEQLKTEDVNGKIVVFVQPWNGYRKTVKYRRSALKVQEKGAVGLLVKSVGPFSIGSPHTGAGARGARIPAACITIEEADMLQRWQRRGKRITIRMKFNSREAGTVSSRNVIFQLTGSEKPQEVVLLSGHLDSWDVGQGALDDGGGCAAMWHALYSLKHLGLTPKRTIRVIFWTGEEQGLLGADHYYRNQKNNSDGEKIVFVSESDQGAFRPRTWQSSLLVTASPSQASFIDQIIILINRLGVPLSIQLAGASRQGDVKFWADDGVPAVNYRSDRGEEYYFNFHHSNGDYMSVFEQGDLEYTTAIFAILAHLVANSPFDPFFSHATSQANIPSSTLFILVLLYFPLSML